MRRVGAAMAALFMFAAVIPAKAQSVSAPSSDGAPGVGVGVICNTSEQAERFIALRSQGRAADEALGAVNGEAKNPRACGVAAVAFTRDKTVLTRPMGDRLVQIVRINIIAGFNGTGWQRASAMTIQYAVVEAEGQSI